MDQAEHRARLDESETDIPPACVPMKSAQGFREGQPKAFGQIHKRPAPDSEVHLTEVKRTLSI